MDVQRIREVRDADFYLDLAFNRATKKRDKVYMQVKDSKKLSRIVKSRMTEIAKVETIGSTLHDRFSDIVKSFPSYDQLSPYYQEVMKCLIDVDLMRTCLSKMTFAQHQVRKLEHMTLKKIKSTIVLAEMNSLRRTFYGRVSSVLKQVNPSFGQLEVIRKQLRKMMPPVKEGEFTVAIAGFPNVGKSTLLSMITSSSPEINSYPFTTRGINIGYIKKLYHKIQLLDTPGTLNRFNKMNDIEKLAYLTLQHVADIIVYVYDLTEEYPLEDQHALLKRVLENNKETYIYLSKTDIIEPEKIEKFKSTNTDKKIITDREELVQLLLDLKVKMHS